LLIPDVVRTRKDVKDSNIIVTTKLQGLNDRDNIPQHKFLTLCPTLLLQNPSSHLLYSSYKLTRPCLNCKLLKGTPVERTELLLDLPTLHNATVMWTLEAFKYLCKNPQIVLQAWAKCEASPELNLSFKSI
jgi:hypothetical protein